ncbi:MAG TPA: glycosyltransferase family 2 protein [Acidimicrobiales bacterium]
MTAESSDEAAVELSVVLPAYNEVTLLGSTVTNLVSGLSDTELTYEIVIVENGSTDDTLLLARRLAEEVPRVRVLTRPIGDYGAALEAGISASRGRFVATFDVDYYDLAFLRRALELLTTTDAGVVIASKRAPGSDDQRSWSRRGMTFAHMFVVRHLLDLRVSDAHGMKVIRRAELLPVIEATVLRDSIFDVEYVLRAERAGITIEELPAIVVELRPARTAIMHRAVRAVADVFRLRHLLGKPQAS